MHKERLCYYSSYFNAALTGEFKESAAGVVELPDQDVEIVEVVESWLYTRKLRQDHTKALDERDLSHLIGAYVFGERFDMPLLRNAVVNAIVAHKSVVTGLAKPTDIQYLYDHSPLGSHLRRLLVAVFAFNVATDWFESHLDDFPKEFVFELTLFNMKRLDSNRPEEEVAPFVEDICQFHEHSDAT